VAPGAAADAEAPKTGAESAEGETVKIFGRSKRLKRASAEAVPVCPDCNVAMKWVHRHYIRDEHGRTQDVGFWRCPRCPFTC
jgi:uncharacterized protein with PIN domain